MRDTHDAAVSGSAAFSTATEGLRECGPPEVVELADGDSVQLEVFGGGTFLFTVIFDPETNRISNLSYNAPL